MRGRTLCNEYTCTGWDTDCAEVVPTKTELPTITALNRTKKKLKIIRYFLTTICMWEEGKGNELLPARSFWTDLVSLRWLIIFHDAPVHVLFGCIFVNIEIP